MFSSVSMNCPIVDTILTIFEITIEKIYTVYHSAKNNSLINASNGSSFGGNFIFIAI